MRPLSLLERAFDAAAAAGRPVAVWWRDDDAVRVGPRLERTMALARRTGARPALAVIPAGVEAGLLDWCAERADVLQHGAAHLNHQAAGKSAELGDARATAPIVAELVALRPRLACAAFVPVMVPPWNRMRADLGAPLAAAGYRGVSQFGGGVVADPIRRVDTHIDPIAWRAGRDLADDAALCAMVERGLAASGPLGLLTHHAVETEAVAAFVADFAALVAQHPGAVWTDAATLFAADPGAAAAAGAP